MTTFEERKRNTPSLVSIFGLANGSGNLDNRGNMVSNMDNLNMNDERIYAELLHKKGVVDQVDPRNTVQISNDEKHRLLKKALDLRKGKTEISKDYKVYGYNPMGYGSYTTFNSSLFILIARAAPSETIELFLKRGAARTINDVQGVWDTTWRSANEVRNNTTFRYGEHTVLTYLLQCAWGKYIVAYDKSPGVHVASRVLKLLLKYGADPNQKYRVEVPDLGIWDMGVFPALQKVSYSGLYQTEAIPHLIMAQYGYNNWDGWLFHAGLYLVMETKLTEHFGPNDVRLSERYVFSLIKALRMHNKAAFKRVYKSSDAAKRYLRVVMENIRTETNTRAAAARASRAASKAADSASKTDSAPSSLGI